MNIKIVIAELVHNRVASVSPIDGVAIGRQDDKSTWRIDFKPEATASERMLAQDVLDAFDVLVEEQKLVNVDATKKAARDRIRNLPDTANVTAKDLREAGLV